MNNHDLQHGNFKYIRRVWKDGKWNYTYKDDKTFKSNKGTIEAYQKHGNKHSRNMPGSSATESNTGTQMTRLQRAQAMAKGTGNYREWNKITTDHAVKLRKNNNDNTHSRNTNGGDYRSQTSIDLAKFKGSDMKTVKQTTKKQIRQGIRKAKVKTLKREAAKAIKRAQDWLKDLLD